MQNTALNRRIPSRRSSRHHSSGRSHWSSVAFLFTFTVLLIAICHYFLIPALEARRHATPDDKLKLRAWSTLLLAVMLFILIAGLLLTVRIGRFFFPRPDVPRVHTKHVDAWAEAGKRLEVPKQNREESDEDQTLDG